MLLEHKPASWSERVGVIGGYISDPTSPVSVLCKRQPKQDASHHINPNSVDDSGRTPLSYAAGLGKLDAVELLLGLSGIDTNLPCRKGYNPLGWSALGCWNWKEVLQLFLRSKQFRVNSKLGNPLSNAVELNHTGMVNALLEVDSIDPDFRDVHGRTPLSYVTRRDTRGYCKNFAGDGESRAKCER